MAKGKLDNERIITVNLRNGFMDSPLHKRGKAAIHYLKSFFEKNLKEVSKIKISESLNHEMLVKGPKKPLHKIKVKIRMDDDVAVLMLPDETEETKKKKKIRAKPIGNKSKLQQMLASKIPIKSEESEPKPKKPNENQEKPETHEKEAAIDVKKASETKNETEK